MPTKLHSNPSNICRDHNANLLVVLEQRPKNHLSQYSSTFGENESTTFHGNLSNNCWDVGPILFSSSVYYYKQDSVW